MPTNIWLAETAGIDEKLIKKAVEESLQSDKYQEQCKKVRKVIGWSGIEKAILNKIAK